jgi:hypothetical protein
MTTKIVTSKVTALVWGRFEFTSVAAACISHTCDALSIVLLLCCASEGIDFSPNHAILAAKRHKLLTNISADLGKALNKIG